jgi:hypothetical protein
VIDVLLIQLFWFSFIIIGLGLLLLYRRTWLLHHAEPPFWKFFSMSSVLIKLFMAFLIGVGICIVPIAVAYVFELPIVWLSLFYLCLLIGSVTFMASQYSFLIRSVRIKPTKRHVALYILVLVALGFDYAVSLWTGVSFNGDAPLHLAKIQLFLNNDHLTLADPFVGYNGILDLRYSTNIAYALQAIGASLLHLTALKFWFYSYAFSRWLVWLSLFTLAKVFLPQSTPKEWPYIILILCPFMYNGYFFTNAELPHAVVLIWISSFLVGLKLLFETNSKFLVLLAALLIATTHALAALEVIGFLVILILILALSKAISRQQLVTLATAVCLLAVPVGANAVIPSRSTAIANTKTTAYGLHGVGLEERKLGPIVMSLPRLSTTPEAFSPLDLKFFLVGAFLVPYVFLLKRVRQPAIKIFTFSLILIVALEAFNVAYASLFGSIYLIYKLKNKQLKILVLLATIYYALIAYNPIVLTLTQNKIPLWFIARFQDFNTLAYVTPIIGMLAAYEGLGRYIQVPKRAGSYYWLLAILAVVAVLPSHPFPISATSATTFNRQAHVQNAEAYTSIDNLRRFNPLTDNQVVYTNDPQIINFLGMVTTSKQIGLIDNEQSNQEQNLNLRTGCQQRIFQGLGLADLRAARVTTVILIPGGSDGYTAYGDIFTFHSRELQPYALADSLPYLRFEKQIGQDRIYRVIGQASNQAIASSVCQIPYKQ